jgi:hypothetical protein
VVMRRTTNHVVGLQREAGGDVTVWTSPLLAGTNAIGTTFTVRRQPGGWTIMDQKQDPLHD